MKLPDSIQAVIQSGTLPASRAVELTSDFSDEVLQELGESFDPDRDAASQAREVDERLRTAALRESVEQRARDEGATFLANPHDKFGARWDRHQLRCDEEIQAARERGDLAYSAPAWADPGSEPVPWRMSVPPEVVQQDVVRVERAAAAESGDREARAARKARRAFLTGLVVRKPSSKECLDVAGTALLAGAGLGGQVTRLARKTAQAAGVGPALREDDDWSWRLAVDALPAAASREHLAWVVALAALEDHVTGRNPGSWSHPAIRYLEYLHSRGYALTGWEHEQLAAAAQHRAEVAGADEAEFTGSADGDSGVITPDGTDRSAVTISDEDATVTAEDGA